MNYSLEDFKFLKCLEDKWELVLGELQILLDEQKNSETHIFDEWHEKEIIVAIGMSMDSMHSE